MKPMCMSLCVCVCVFVFVFVYVRYWSLPPGSMGVYDPTEIRNRGMLLRFQKEAFIKIGYHLIVFFILLYWSVDSLCVCVCWIIIVCVCVCVCYFFAVLLLLLSQVDQMISQDLGIFNIIYS